MKSKRNGFWKTSVFAILFAVLAFVSIGCASADAIYVPEVDTIIVRDGTYPGNVVVNKSLTIQSENGSVVTMVEVNSSDDHVFEVTTDYMNISGFTMAVATWVVDDSSGVEYR